LLPPPHTTTLFPYTTLFRSNQAPPAGHRGDLPVEVDEHGVEQRGARGRALRQLMTNGRQARHELRNAGIESEPLEARAHAIRPRSEEHTSELQSRSDLVCRL